LDSISYELFQACSLSTCRKGIHNDLEVQQEAICKKGCCGLLSHSNLSCFIFPETPVNYFIFGKA
jgi:hypothetical protein